MVANPEATHSARIRLNGQAHVRIEIVLLVATDNGDYQVHQSFGIGCYPWSRYTARHLRHVRLNGSATYRTLSFAVAGRISKASTSRARVLICHT